MSNFKKWYEDHKDDILAAAWFIGMAAIGGVVGAKIASNKATANLDLERQKIADTLNKATSTLNNLNSRVDSAVQSVYASKAKESFERKLQEAATDQAIANAAKAAVKDKVDTALSKAISNAVEGACINDAVKEYIDDNSTYFNGKIIKTIRNIFDDEFADQIKDAVTEAVADAID